MSDFDNEISASEATLSIDSVVPPIYSSVIKMSVGGGKQVEISFSEKENQVSASVRNGEELTKIKRSS